MRLIFHGELRKRFGPSFEMHADTVAEALEGFSRQVDWPSEQLVDVVGYRTEEQLRGPANGDVHIMPAMQGGGGKFGAIILGAIMVVAGVLLLPSNPALGWSLIASGSVMILQGVVALFMKAPKLKNVNDPDASKYLSVNKNTTAIGTPITMAYGQINLYGHWLSLQSDSNNLTQGVFPANPT